MTDASGNTREAIPHDPPPGRRQASEARVRHAWTTPKSAAFFAAAIVLALVLARLLAPLLELQPG